MRCLQRDVLDQYSSPQTATCLGSSSLYSAQVKRVIKRCCHGRLSVSPLEHVQASGCVVCIVILHEVFLRGKTPVRQSMELVVLQATAGCCLYLAVEKRFNLAMGDKVGSQGPTGPKFMTGPPCPSLLDLWGCVPESMLKYYAVL